MTAEEAIRNLRFLASYEEMPKHPKETFETAIEALEKVEEYKRLEEQGLLLRLPYPLDTKKIFYAEDGEIYYLRAERITVEKMPITNKTVFDVDGYEFCIEDIGKTLFLTEEEAEAKLKEMEG